MKTEPMSCRGTKPFDLLFVYVPFLICLAYSCQPFSWRKPSDGDRKHGCYWAGTCDPPFTRLAVRSARPIRACLFIVWGGSFQLESSNKHLKENKTKCKHKDSLKLFVYLFIDRIHRERSSCIVHM